MIKFVPLLETVAYQKTKCNEESYYEGNIGETYELLKVLRPIDRNIIILKILHEKSFEEIGKIIEMKPSSARKRFERAKKKIAKDFETCRGGLSNEECSSR